MKFNTIEEAIDDICQGRLIVIADAADRENEGDIFIPADKVTAAHINFMATHGRGLICMPITKGRAALLNFPPMSEKNTSSHETKFTVSIDAAETTTGISAEERAFTIRKAATSSSSSDFKRPGHIFPLVADDLGVVKRPGHTEAAVDLATLAQLTPAGVICEIMNDDGTMASGSDLIEFAQKHHLKIITIADLIRYRMKNELFVEKIVETKIPTEYGEFQLIAFKNKLTGTEELVLFKSFEKNPLVRIHSECLTSEVFGSLRCDCDEQLHTAMSIIGKQGGIIIYLRQEGRGIGLLNKLHAYALQDKGTNTIEANEQLGHPVDARDYAVAAQILKYFNINLIKLLTNNPEKAKQLENYGITIIEQLNIETMPTVHNVDYLNTKRDQMGHTFDVDEKLIFL